MYNNYWKKNGNPTPKFNMNFASENILRGMEETIWDPETQSFKTISKEDK